MQITIILIIYIILITRSNTLIINQRTAHNVQHFNILNIRQLTSLRTTLLSTNLETAAKTIPPKKKENNASNGFVEKRRTQS